MADQTTDFDDFVRRTARRGVEARNCDVQPSRDCSAADDRGVLSQRRVRTPDQLREKFAVRPPVGARVPDAGRHSDPPPSSWSTLRLWQEEDRRWQGSRQVPRSKAIIVEWGTVLQRAAHVFAVFSLQRTVTCFSRYSAAPRRPRSRRAGPPSPASDPRALGSARGRPSLSKDTRDLLPEAPSFIRRVLVLHNASSMGWHARRARSPQPAQARGGHALACRCGAAPRHRPTVCPTSDIAAGFSRLRAESKPRPAVSIRSRCVPISRQTPAFCSPGGGQTVDIRPPKIGVTLTKNATTLVRHCGLTISQSVISYMRATYAPY